jgi:phosphoribosylformimino-5-aminoimidazole carboxamide ribotide isomerase
MIVYPAIDIRGGKAVRLVEGDYDRETVFDADPIDAALRWADGGADWIHIVDLDGARDGVRLNADVISRIRSAVTCRLQLGGGMRSMDDIRAVTALGIDRVVIGSAAVTHPELVTTAVSEFGSGVAVGLDARDGMLATQGWREQTDVSAVRAARRFASEGVEHFVFTDIRRDGRLQGPNIGALREMINEVPANIIASGGIGTIDDVAAVRDLGSAGVIIGAALYHKRITLADALAVASTPAQETSA